LYGSGSAIHLELQDGTRDVERKYASAEVLLDFATVENNYNSRVLALGEDPDLLLNGLEILITKLE
jgi:hypothetical protein